MAEFFLSFRHRMPLEEGIMKWSLYAILAILAGVCWLQFSSKGRDIDRVEREIMRLEEAGDPDELVPNLKTEVNSIGNERTFIGILLTFLTAGLVGIFFVLQVLPSLAHKATHAIYDSAEMMEHDVMHDARSLLAQGDYHGAIEAFKAAADADPMNRLPWVEITKIYKDNLGDPAAAIQTIRYALERQEWELNDAAYFLFRLAELYDEVEGDRASAVAIMQQVIEQFPNTRHSANANHKLHEWAVQDEAARAAAEEEEFIARMRAGGGAEAAQAATDTYQDEASAAPHGDDQDAGGPGAAEDSRPA